MYYVFFKSDRLLGKRKRQMEKHIYDPYQIESYLRMRKLSGRAAPFIKEWTKSIKNAPQTDFARKIGARIVELIKRDPLSKKLSQIIMENLEPLRRIWLPPRRKLGKPMDSSPVFSIDCFRLNRNFGNGENYIVNLKATVEELQRKWYCEIHTSVHIVIDEEKTHLFGVFPIDTLWSVIFDIPSPVEVPITPSPIKNAWPLDDVIIDDTPGDPSLTKVYSPIYKLPIFINLSLIDNNDQKLIKKIVIEAVKKHLKKYKNSPQEEPDGKFLIPIFHQKDLMFLYHIKDSTFEQYLKWYDLNIEAGSQKPNEDTFSFRAIAFLDFIERKHPDRYEDVKIKIGEITETIKSMRGKKTLKGVIGQPVKGEDKIEKGVKLIYGAIHRNPYPSTKTKQKDYNCPEHGLECTKECKYLIDFMKDFNRRMMLFKPLHTTDPAHLSHVIGEDAQEDPFD